VSGSKPRIGGRLESRKLEFLIQKNREAALHYPVIKCTAAISHPDIPEGQPYIYAHKCTI
jgi:hypothetical protein